MNVAVLNRFKVKLVWLCAYGAFWMGIVFVCLSVMQLLGTPAKDVSPLFAGLLSISTLLLAGFFVLTWKRMIFSENDFQTVSDILGGSISQEGSMTEMKAGKVRIIISTRNISFWRFDLFWTNPQRRLIWKWLQRKRESSVNIEARYLWKLIRSASPITLVLDSDCVSFAESKHLLDDLSAQNPSIEFELWIEHIVDGRNFISHLKDIAVSDHATSEKYYILAYLPPWEKSRIKDIIRGTCRKINENSLNSLNAQAQ